MALDRTWYNTLVDDDGSNTVGTIWDKAAVDHVYDDVDAEIARLDTDMAASGAVEVVASTVTGTQNDYLIGSSGAANVLIEWAGASDATFTGLKEFSSAATTTGRVVTIKNTGAKVAYFAYNSGSSLTANRLRNIATTAATPVAPGGYLTYVYNGSAWRLISHAQGFWITPTFAAGNFTAGGSMTWSVDSGDVTQCRFRLDGTQLTISFVLATTSVGGTPTVDLRINNGAWGGFTVAGVQYLLPLIYKDAGGALSNGFMQAGSALGGSTWIGCYKAAAAVWSAATNTTDVYGTMSFEVS